MRFVVRALAIAALAFGATAVSAQPAADAPVLTASGHYSVDTTRVAFLLDDPAAAAILQRLIPGVYANDMFKTMGRDNTLKGVQQYEPGELTDANLARIQAEFDKLPPRK